LKLEAEIELSYPFFIEMAAQETVRKCRRPPFGYTWLQKRLHRPGEVILSIAKQAIVVGIKRLSQHDGIITWYDRGNNPEKPTV
jgi:hypothetical protein